MPHPTASKHSFLSTDFLAVVLLTVAVQALTPEEIPHELAPYAKIVGGIALALGVLLGKTKTLYVFPSGIQK